MSPKLVKKLIIGAIIIIPLLVAIFWAIGVNNQEVDLRNLFNAKLSERTTIYDNKVFKTVAAKAQITLKADSSVFIISGVGVLWRFRPRDCVSVYDYFINDLGEKNPKRVFFWSKLSPI